MEAVMTDVKTDVKINDNSIDVNGTHKQGNLNMGYDKLVAKLGEPIHEDGDKVQVEWELEFPDGTVATIHDWKEYCEPSDITSWSIGGFSQDAVTNVRKLLNK